MAEKQTKFIFVTGGVVSGLGKGITAASLGRLLKCRGLKVAQRGGGDALAQAGHDTAGDEDILGLLFCHKNTSSSIGFQTK